MQPLERLYDNDGNELCLFPLEYMYVSDANDPPEHHLLAIDFLGWNSLGRVYDCPCYAPFSGSVVYTGNDNNMIYWSTSPVRCADGTLSDVSILVAHSNTAPAIVGTTFVQGQLWYHTGNYVAGVTSFGDHLHMEVAKGHVMWDSGGQWLDNPAHMYNIMYVNDTTLVNDGGFTWQTYTQPVPPTPSTTPHRFPWAIYARRLRDKRTHV